LTEYELTTFQINYMGISHIMMA